MCYIYGFSDGPDIYRGIKSPRMSDFIIAKIQWCREEG